ncbi:MAG: RNA degradosome polyphosphate kinase [Sporichthyaceae bacterium]
MTALGEGFTAQTEPDTRRFADDSAEEIEELASVPALAEDRLLPTDRFLDRESSWLDFNSRVLELAKDEQVPVLERLRFIAIFARNLDEFLMVRVAALHRRVAAGITTRNSAGATPRERLDRVSHRAHGFVEEHAATFRDEVLPALDAAGIAILRWGDLEPDEITKLRALFDERIYPVLTPLAVDPAHPFPYISGLSLNLAVVLRDGDTGTEHFARLKVPPVLPRFVATNEASTRFVPLEDIIAAHLPQLFSGLEVVETSAFRVTRNEDLEIDNDVENLVHALERELSRRRFGAPVRLEVDCEISDRVLELLVRELGVARESVYRIPAPLDLAGVWPIADLNVDGLRYPGFVPGTHPMLRSADGSPADVFAAMRTSDILLHHPYDSFTTSVQRFIEQAATDPAVQAIKLTLYRTSGESPIVDTLIDAARAGKQVLVVVEIKARFDEQANIRWARKLEQAGCHVVYGLVGLKTHCKLVLVVRSEESGSLRRYVHVGTGNYHPKTARIYEDLGLLTSDDAMGADVADLFNHLSGYTRRSGYDTMLVAPDTARTGLQRLIDREIDNASKGLAAGISVKVNSLVDESIIDGLYAASRAGVPIDLLVRGMCTLRPGVPGLSETIRVRSILGRFLEHSRVFRFANAGSPEFLIGSADIMDRNLDRRVEALVEVRDDTAKASLDELLSMAWSDEAEHWWLTREGTWSRATGDARVDLQEALIARMGSERVDAADEGS